MYTRSEFERLLHKYSEKRGLKVPFKSKLKSYSSQDFWDELFPVLTPALKVEIEQYRDLVLNPFSHYNTEKHEIKSELIDAMEAIKKLKNELSGTYKKRKK
ncbi:MAG: hypothetical protein GY757_19830 [bacterium]|nr:hypothetical protein [bacterium]